MMEEMCTDMATIKKHVKAIIQLRRATESEWTEVDPILRIGEPALSTDVYKLKIGNGQNHWSELEYLNKDEVTSVNGQIGDVTITEALEPLIGTIDSITPFQVVDAIEEGRNILIKASHTFYLDKVPYHTLLSFASFNKAIDIGTNGEEINLIISTTVARYGNEAILFELIGGKLDGVTMSWRVIDQRLPSIEYLDNITPHYTSDLYNDSGYISEYSDLILDCGTSTTNI